MENTIVELLTSCKSYNYNKIKKGKKRMSLIFAASVVNSQSTPFCSEFLATVHGPSNALSVGRSGIL